MATATASAETRREPTTVEKLQGLRWSIASNAANTFFVQFTFFGSVFVLFLNELGLSKSEMGFVLSLLPFAGLLAIFVAPRVARFGYKRTYLTFFGVRGIVAAGLLLTPWVMAQWGAQATLIYITATVALFSLLRAIGVTASFPWVQEYVPNSLRGKYTAANNVFATVAGFLAVAGAGIVLGRFTGLTGFMLLIALGVFCGFISVWLAAFIPGGAPAPHTEAERAKGRDLGEAIRDGRFLRYLGGVALISLAVIPLGAFLPLFMREEIGLMPSQVVMLQTGGLLGGLLTSYLWGWAADRYGSKPVMLTGLSLSLIMPVFWMLMPRFSPVSLYIALAIAFLKGVVDLGWGIGSARLLYVSIVPPEKKSDYMALYYAWTGTIGGLSQLLGGRILDLSQGISGQFFFFPLDPYLPLFLAGILLPLASTLLMRSIQADDSVGVGEFVGIFLRGNPFLAMSSLVRYHLARDEYATVLTTERLSQSRSLLTVDELLEALEDPRFNVRYEAIVSIAHMRPNSRLTEALIDILQGSELSLSNVAAWALGRLRDERALDALRQGLDSPYRSIQAHSARALGSLGATEMAPLLAERLANESDKGLQMAYASALGQLAAPEATGALLALLEATENQGARRELALSVARIVGEEHLFIQLLRQVRADPGTASAQAVHKVKRKLQQARPDDGKLQRSLDECADALARQDLAQGSGLLAHILSSLAAGQGDGAGPLVLRACARQLESHRDARIETLVLALHTLAAEK